jgi:hypothetical protein
LVVWLFGCLVVWLFGCLVVWLFGCLFLFFCFIVHDMSVNKKSAGDGDGDGDHDELQFLMDSAPVKMTTQPVVKPKKHTENIYDYTTQMITPDALKAFQSTTFNPVNYDVYMVNEDDCKVETPTCKLQDVELTYNLDDTLNGVVINDREYVYDTEIQKYREIMKSGETDMDSTYVLGRDKPDLRRGKMEDVDGGAKRRKMTVRRSARTSRKRKSRRPCARHRQKSIVNRRKKVRR